MGIPRWVWTVLPLVGSNAFMAFAWYDHVKQKLLPLLLAIGASWLIALPEYVLRVPANRMGHGDHGGPFTLPQLKILQEAITLLVFTVFTVYVAKEKMRVNDAVAFGLTFASVAVSMIGRGGDGDVRVVGPVAAVERKQSARWYLLSMIDPTAETPDSPRWIRWGALVLGPLAAILGYFWLGQTSLGHAGCATVALGVLMAIWWITEAIPVEATSLLPMGLFPLLGIASMRDACAPYGDPVVFFFMGGMLIGAAMEKWGLPRRFALVVLSRVGGNPMMLVGGVVLATGIISMWVNNTSTAVMMLPIALSLSDFVARHAGKDEARGVRNFGACLVLGVAYASSIGGVGTLFGSSPNVILTGQLRKSFGETLSFVEYARIGVPVMVVLLPLTWLMLIAMYPPTFRRIDGLHGLVEKEKQLLGRWTRGELTVLAVFVLAMAAWILMDPINGWIDAWRRGAGQPGTKTSPAVLSEAGIAVIAALALFLIPVSIRKHEFALDWKTGGKIPWGILLLFGGGMSLAEALRAHGVNEIIGQQFSSIGSVHPLIVLSLVTLVLILITEVASNTAVATTFIPIAIAVAPAIGMHPFLLATAVSLAASSGFALPIGTPPNALAYATGRVPMGRFVRAGIVVDILAAVVITCVLSFGNGVLFTLPTITIPNINQPAAVTPP